MRYLDDTHNWWSSPFDGYDAWEDGCVDKDEFYNSLCSWQKDEVDDLESEEAKDELMHEFWLKKERDKWEAANDWS